MDGSLLSAGSSTGSSCDISQVFACNICFLSATNPVETGCGHLFCWPCMHRFVQDHGKPCPVCATTLSSNIHVVPKVTDYGSAMLHLPTAEELPQELEQIREQIEDNLDHGSLCSTTTVSVRASSPVPEESEEIHEALCDMGNRIEVLKRRVRREQRRLRILKRKAIDAPICDERDEIRPQMEELQKWRLLQKLLQKILQKGEDGPNVTKLMEMHFSKHLVKNNHNS